MAKRRHREMMAFLSALKTELSVTDLSIDSGKGTFYLELMKKVKKKSK